MHLGVVRQKKKKKKEEEEEEEEEEEGKDRVSRLCIRKEAYVRRYKCMSLYKDYSIERGVIRPDHFNIIGFEESIKNAAATDLEPLRESLTENVCTTIGVNT